MKPSLCIFFSRRQIQPREASLDRLVRIIKLNTLVFRGPCEYLINDPWQKGSHPHRTVREKESIRIIFPAGVLLFIHSFTGVCSLNINWFYSESPIIWTTKTTVCSPYLMRRIWLDRVLPLLRSTPHVQPDDQGWITCPVALHQHHQCSKSIIEYGNVVLVVVKARSLR